MITERDYEVAKENLDARQAFLDGIDMEKYAPFVKRIRNRDKTHIGRNFTMGTNSCFNLGRQAIIHVGNSAFQDYSSADFYNVIVHHEGVHAKQLYNDPLTLLDVGKNTMGTIFKKPKLLKKMLVMEVEAYGNQMEHPSFEECSPRYQEKIWNRHELLATYVDNNFE